MLPWRGGARFSFLSCHGTTPHWRGITDLNEDDSECGDGCGNGQSELPAEKPGFVHDLRIWFSRLTYWRHRERHNTPAIWTDREMGERLLILMRRQSVLREGAELVRVGMMSGLEEVAHSGSDALVGLVSLLSENEEV